MNEADNQPCYTCPVCGYKRLRYPAADEGVICPCCGTQFGYSDAGTTHAQLRREWVREGMKWYSRVTPAPEGWNPAEQLGDITDHDIVPRQSHERVKS